MPFPRRSCSKMATDEVTVVDVYDLASDIGKECELIIEKHGPEAVTALLPKVIGALELLEALAARSERDSSALQDLADKVAHLENDKLEKAEYRQRFEKELEIIEEQWRAETAELVSAISRLQEENKRLQKERCRDGAENQDSESANDGVSDSCSEQLWRRMGESNEQQRATLREKEVLLEDKETIIEGLTDQVKRLAASNREVRRKQKYLVQQMRVVCAQRAELDAAVQARQREVTALRLALANEHVIISGGDNGTQLADLIRERDQLREKLEALQKQISGDTEQPASLEMPSDDTAVSNFDEEEEPPVQGPLPCEPDDAPWKRQQSGIRKFFRKLFSEYDVSVGPFPGRSFSTFTTKMSTK
ncbi:rab interacting lysosomal protein like [Arctopsyche grandis]|uniref:rab interacting lysosomal protein like n=1 Tax=Arctopsyche grandis TaxID=121162 RepID=UPI00406D7EC9